MMARSTEPEQIELASGTTVVVFRRAGDRWGHELRLGDGRVWRSVEGSNPEADPRWPGSPPVVEVLEVRSASQPVLLGVGRAGRSHYSISVTAWQEAPDTLLFDVACRIQESPLWLGSTYAADDAGEPVKLPADCSAVAPATIRWTYTVGPAGIQLRG